MALARLVVGRWAKPMALGMALALLTSLAGRPLVAAPAPMVPPDVFPPTTLFRALQLSTLACARDNTADKCTESRRVADALMDHPRLPARCKDVLWSIRNLAVEAPTNSPERRDPIDQVANEVTIACRQTLRVKPESKPQAPPAEGGARPAGS
jgi:hypothetical protein